MNTNDKKPSLNSLNSNKNISMLYSVFIINQIKIKLL